jgi:hypothetical protein
MMVKEMKYVSKIVSKIYAVVNGYNTVVAEVIKGCGCGFDYLIRIKPEYKYELNIFSECIKLCDITAFDVSRDIIDKSINDGYLYRNENIAFIADDII